VRPYGYDLMADDVVALLDTLHIAKADVSSAGATAQSLASISRSAAPIVSAASLPSPPTP
jgi:hypothetical protein